MWSKYKTCDIKGINEEGLWRSYNSCDVTVSQTMTNKFA